MSLQEELERYLDSLGGGDLFSEKTAHPAPGARFSRVSRARRDFVACGTVALDKFLRAISAN